MAQTTTTQSASTGDDNSDTDDRTVIVIGTRLGSGSATDVKRNALQSISALTAEDLAQIPETAVADILRRVASVSVNQSGGRGITTIRGLRDIGYLLNGRNLTSTVSRGYDAAALPGDLISGVDVYKTPSASQIEGGIGGVLAFRTRRPLDFAGFAGSITAKAGYTEVADNIRPYLSGFLSDRVDTSIGGVEIGYQQRPTFLPGLLSGLGLSGSFTYIDSLKSKTARGYEVRLEQLVPRTYPAAIDYKRGGLVGNLAYVRRSRILLASVGDPAGRPLYAEGFSTLDLSPTYGVVKNISVQFNALNLTNNRQEQNFLNRQFFNQTFQEGRRLFAGVLTMGDKNRRTAPQGRRPASPPGNSLRQSG